jgi:hypothetical protein
MCGLSKKQLYRRQFQQRPLKIKAAVRRIVSRSARRDEVTASFPPYAPQDIVPPLRCTACCTCTPEVSADPCSECDCGIPAGGEPQLLLTYVEPPHITKSVRKVSFDPFVKVILVPCIAEYREAGMFDTLWWGPADFKIFRMAAAAALMEFMHKRELVNKRDALRLFILEGAIDDEA